MVWIVCVDAVFNAISRRHTPQIVSSGKNLNSASKVANWITSLLEMVIAKDH